MPTVRPDPSADRRPASRRGRRLALAGVGAMLALPALAQTRRALAPMTDGPFYPPRRWRTRQGDDWDADLTRVQLAGRTRIAEGEHLGLELVVQDTRGRALDGAEVEIWQCDARALYHHPNVEVEAERLDAGFQGFGAARSGGDGQLAFRTIRPVPYPGRTPHIHVKLRHASFGELTSQLFVAGHPGNARDFLWRQLADADRAPLEMQLRAAAADSGLRWQVRHALVVPA